MKKRRRVHVAPVRQHVRIATAAALAKLADVDPAMFSRRIVRDGWEPEEALGLVERARPVNEETIAHKARQRGLDPRLVYNRLKLGWNLERALATPARAIRHRKLTEIARARGKTVEELMDELAAAVVHKQKKQRAS